MSARANCVLSLLLALLAAGPAGVAADRRVIVKVPFASFDPATQTCRVERSPYPIEFTAESDPVALAAFRKVVTSWLLQPPPPGMEREIKLNLTILDDPAAPPGQGRMKAVLKDWKWEFPVVISAQGSSHDDFLSGRFLVESPGDLLNGVLSDQEQRRFTSVDAARVAEFVKQSHSPWAFNSLVRAEPATPEFLASVKARSSTKTAIVESEISRQIEELQKAIAGLERETGGCKVSSVHHSDYSVSFEITVPSLDVKGTPESESTLLVELMRGMPPEERARLVAEDKQLNREWRPLADQYKALRTSANADTPTRREEARALQEKMRPLSQRLLALSNVPSARFKKLGLTVTPALRSVDAPPRPEIYPRLLKEFYAKLATLVEFYDSADIDILAGTAEKPK